MAGMPHLVKVQEQYKAQGLIIIASHLQDATQEQVQGLCRAKHVNYTVVSQGRVGGDPATGLPHAFLFDASGKCVKDGMPDELIHMLDGLFQSEPHWITRGKKLEAAPVAKIAEQLKAGKSFGWALDELAKIIKKDDPKSKDDATYLSDQIKAEADRMLKVAKDAEDGDAYLAFATYEEIKATFKKTEYDKQADERLKELKKDKAFETELKAGKLVAQIDDLCSKLISPDKKINLDYPGNRDTVANIQAAMKALKKSYGDTKACKKCLDGLKGYGF